MSSGAMSSSKRASSTTCSTSRASPTESSITRRFGGLGLGLAISKAMVEAHRGKLSVESAGTGQGATFTIELRTVAAPTRELPEKKTPVETKVDGHQKILLVDDHEDAC